MGAVKGKDGNRWIHVRLPGRPSGHTGWILADQTIRSSTEWRIVVKVSTRRVTVYRDGLVVRTFPAVVPKASTPTPYGQFFVEEALAISPHDPGGPYALAISARSDIFQEFEGGPGQIAIHGTGGLSDPLGSAASHGCIRAQPGSHHVDVESHRRRSPGHRRALTEHRLGGILAGCNETCARRRCTRRSRRGSAVSPSPGSGRSRRASDVRVEP